jgi:hypothetical protein
MRRGIELGYHFCGPRGNQVQRIIGSPAECFLAPQRQFPSIPGLGKIIPEYLEKIPG